MIARKQGKVWIPDFIPPIEAEIRTDERWNGWACPRFTRENAQRIAEIAVTPDESGLAMYTSWRWEMIEDEGDTVKVDTLILVHNPEVTDNDEPDYFGPDADGMYHVGSHAWTWEDLDWSNQDLADAAVHGHA